ncbi:unnamed protein product [Gadus morhua 'NCC']
MERACDCMPRTTNMGDRGAAVGQGPVMTPMVVSSFQPVSLPPPLRSLSRGLAGSLGGRPVALIASRSECDTQWDRGVLSF